jgi:zinc-binding alcohol dehydrogenase family protein
VARHATRCGAPGRPVGVHVVTLASWLGVPLGGHGREGGRLRPVRVPRPAPRRGGPGPVASRWAGASKGRCNFGQPQRLGGPARIACLCANRRDDFTRTTQPYDLILDLVAHRSVFAYQRALAPGGKYRCVGGSVRALLRVVTMGSVVGRVTGRSIGVLVVKEGPSYFEPIADFCVAGSVRIPIDRSFALDELPAALARVGEGRACGKVVVVPS